MNTTTFDGIRKKAGAVFLVILVVVIVASIYDAGWSLGRNKMLDEQTEEHRARDAERFKDGRWPSPTP